MQPLGGGQVLFKERNITGLAANQVVGLGISQVPEGRQIFAHLSVEDNIHLGAYRYSFKRQYREETRQKIQEMYALFPGGPGKLSAKLAGLKKPTGCV